MGMQQEFLQSAAIDKRKKKDSESETLCAIIRERMQVVKKGKTVCASISCIAFQAVADVSSTKKFIQHSPDHANETSTD
jgi:hypothetical protein